MNDADTYKSYLKRTVYVGGLAEEVDDKVLRSAFIPFGDIVDVQVIYSLMCVFRSVLVSINIRKLNQF